MDTKSKVLLIVVIASLATAIFLTYQRSFVEKDFEYFDSSSETDIE